MRFENGELRTTASMPSSAISSTRLLTSRAMLARRGSAPADLMTSDILTVAPEDTIGETARRWSSWASARRSSPTTGN